MFTGLIEELGTLVRVEARPQGRRFQVRAPGITADARIGDSIALNGCCLTVVERDAECFALEAVPETLERTTLGEWQEGDAINLERALRLEDPTRAVQVMMRPSAVAASRRTAADSSVMSLRRAGSAPPSR